MIQTHALNLNIRNTKISLIIPSVLPSVYILRAKLNRIRIAYVASVSVRFRNKERGTRVKAGPREKWLLFHFSRGQN